MKLTRMITMTMLAGLCPYAATAKPAATRTVTVCAQGWSMPAMIQARMTASRLFREIGVRLQWAKPGSCPAGAIRISISRSTPDSFYPGALGCTWPFGGAQVEIFLDRIEKNNPRIVPNLLGYVIAHKITHVIERTGGHSDHGVMKAHWDWRDFARMEGNRLRFAQDDVDLIFRGLARRTPAVGFPTNAAAISAGDIVPR